MDSSLTTNDQLIKLAYKFSIPLNAVVSKDHLYDMEPDKGGYIVNMEDSDAGSGSHWVAIWFDNYNTTPLYFDSFGIDPPMAIIDFMKKWHSKCIFSTKEIQNVNSGFCGQYCLYFLHQMAKNKGKVAKKYKNFVDLFNDNACSKFK
jgi:hypothetical protein